MRQIRVFITCGMQTVKRIAEKEGYMDFSLNLSDDECIALYKMYSTIKPTNTTPLLSEIMNDLDYLY